MNSTKRNGKVEKNDRPAKRIALVGIGGIAQKVYLPLLAGHPRAEIVGVVSRTASSVRRTAVVDDLERAVFTQNGGRPEERSFGSWDTVLKRRGFEGVVEHFLDCMDDPRRCTVRAGLVLGSHELAERAARSF